MKKQILVILALLIHCDTNPVLSSKLINSPWGTYGVFVAEKEEYSSLYIMKNGSRYYFRELYNKDDYTIIWQSRDTILIKIATTFELKDNNIKKFHGITIKEENYQTNEETLFTGTIDSVKKIENEKVVLFGSFQYMSAKIADTIILNNGSINLTKDVDSIYVYRIVEDHAHANLRTCKTQLFELISNTEKAKAFFMENGNIFFNKIK
jgi:hypothetical protein